jgi:hypothetical protein
MTRAQKVNGWACIVAGDYAYGYLTKCFPQTADAIAIRVEFFLAGKWEEIQEDLRERRDPHDWVEISISEMKE